MMNLNIRKSLLAIGIVLLSICTHASPVIMPSHPRLLVSSSDIGALKQRLGNKDFSKLKEVFDQQINYVTNGITEDGIPAEPIRQKIEALAFSYLIDTAHQRKMGLEAIELSIKYLQSIKSAKGYHPNTNAYEAVFGAALVYDWCYNLLTNTDKLLLMDNMKRVCCLAEYCLSRTTPKQYLSGHYGEFAPTVFLAMGIAAYDEDTTIFNFAYQEQVNNFAASRNPWYVSGAHHQGSQYLHVRYGHEVLQAFILNKLGLKPYSDSISAVTYRDIYARIPQSKDMDGMPEGDCHNSISMGSLYLTYMPVSATLSKDPYLQYYAKINLSRLTEQSTRAFVYYNPNLPSKTFNTLPLSRFFSSPSGLMIARTKWDIDRSDYQSKAMVVLMNMREYSAKNHVHLDVGHFGIYYKGHLALDAGIYQGKDTGNEWGKTNYVNYYARTAAHNSLLILDPEEPTPYEGSNKKAVSRDGGQFSFRNAAWNTSAEMFAAGKSAQIMAHLIAPGLSPDFTYLKGDMTRCYNVPLNVADYPAKADTVRRSFVFLNLQTDSIPGALIVLDKVVSTHATFMKKWLLHSQNEPVLKENEISFVTEADGRNGKLINTVLLPATDNQEVVKIGGEGKEYYLDGKNWGSVTQEDAGKWRIELSPKKESKSDNFLNVIQVMDAKPSPVALAVNKTFSTNGQYVIVTIGNRIVAQQLKLDKHTDKMVFTAGNKADMYKVLITDLKKGYWQITTSVGKQKIRVKEDEGTMYFESKGGQFSIEPVGN